MTVRLSLLAILDQGPCYGYQLKAELDRRSGSARPVNVGQVYNTLERLVRDSLVTRGEIDTDGQIHYAITPDGRAEVARWFDTAVPRSTGGRDEVVSKIVLAATLPGVDMHRLLDRQVESTRARLAELVDTRDSPRASTSRRTMSAELMLEFQILDTEAEERWLIEFVARLVAEPRTHESAAFPVTAPTSGRGRPRRAAPPVT